MTYKTPRLALLDGDIIAYQTAAWAHARQMDFLEMLERLEEQTKAWARQAYADEFIVCISCDRKDNFRRDFWPKYKEHRDGHVDPPGRANCVKFLRNTFRSASIPRLEADDVMGIIGSKAEVKGRVPVIVTIDKDLRQVPGWHLNPDKDDFPVRVTLEEADRFFLSQWLSGDATDNVPGMFRVGPAKAEKIIAAAELEREVIDWQEVVLEAYASHPKKYDRKYAITMARCVRILRHGEFDKTKQKPILWGSDA